MSENTALTSENGWVYSGPIPETATTNLNGYLTLRPNRWTVDEVNEWLGNQDSCCFIRDDETSRRIEFLYDPNFDEQTSGQPPRLVATVPYGDGTLNETPQEAIFVAAGIAFDGTHLFDMALRKLKSYNPEKAQFLALLGLGALLSHHRDLSVFMEYGFVETGEIISADKGWVEAQLEVNGRREATAYDLLHSLTGVLSAALYLKGDEEKQKAFEESLERARGFLNAEHCK